MAWSPSRSRRVDACGGGTPWWEEKHFNLHLSHVFQKCGSFVSLNQLYHRVGGCREGGRREHLWRSSWQGALQAPPGTTPWRPPWRPTWRPPWRSTWRSTWRPPCPAAPSSVPAEYSASATFRPDPGKLPVPSTFQIAPKFHFPGCKKKLSALDTWGRQNSKIIHFSFSQKMIFHLVFCRSLLGAGVLITFSNTSYLQSILGLTGIMEK